MPRIPDDVMTDVFSRFILPEYRSHRDPIRLCFAIEMGHWFYLDYIKPTIEGLPECSLDNFVRQCFKFMPSLLQNLDEPDIILRQWKEYKKRVPVFGAMLISSNGENLLLVEGHSTRGCWTFPRGKIEEREDPFDCAVREVFEETSFDIKKLGDPSRYLERVHSDRKVRLYIVPNVPDNFVFYPKNPGEIANYRWFPIDELPGGVNYTYTKNSRKREQFFMVSQFVRDYTKASKQGSINARHGNHDNRHEARYDNRHDNTRQFQMNDQPKLLGDRHSKSRGHSFSDSTQGNPVTSSRRHLNVHSRDVWVSPKPFTGFDKEPHLVPMPHDTHGATEQSYTRMNKPSTSQTRSYYTTTPPHFSEQPMRGGNHGNDGVTRQDVRKPAVVGRRGGRARREQTARLDAKFSEMRLRNFELDFRPLINCLPPAK